MKKIIFITPTDMANGFLLAGQEQVIAAADNALAVVDRFMADPSFGVIVVDERLLSADADRKLWELVTEWSGVLTVLPSPAMKAADGEDYVSRLLRQAIGYHVRLSTG